MRVVKGRLLQSGRFVVFFKGLSDLDRDFELYKKPMTEEQMQPQAKLTIVAKRGQTHTLKKTHSSMNNYSYLY